MKDLIIAEKPSLCRTLVSAISERAVKKEGYYETDSYYISYAYGHLFGLVDLEEYFTETENKKWTLDNLPFCPASFRFALKKDPATKKTDPEIRKQYLRLKKLHCTCKWHIKKFHRGHKDFCLDNNSSCVFPQMRV